MRVRIYPSDATGCGYYRCQLPGNAARSAGCDVSIASIDAPAAGQPKTRPLPIERHPRNPKLVRAIPVLSDVIVFQRPMEEELASVAIPQLQAAGHAVVVEIDDDIHRLPPQHPAVRELNPKLSPAANWEHLARACRIADLVTVTSPALAARYGSHGRVAVLPNCVPERLLDLPRSSDGQTVGWRGWTRTHPGDLRSAGGGVQDAIDRTGARFLQVGPADHVRQELALREEPEATGPLWDINDFYAALGRLDVGIIPLADSQFNAAKSYLAGIEYAARGVPFVASPVAEYQHLAGQGVGVLAGYRGREWRRELVRILEDDSLRRDLAEYGRQVVADRHTVERNAHLWAEAWETALRNAQARALPAAA